MKENRYDDADFFEQYSQMSRSLHGLSGAGEWHALKSVMPDLAGKQVLDLGCGYGWHCRYAVDNGADRVVGIDLSHKMIEKAIEINSDPKIDYRCCAVEDFEFVVNAFDVVISSLTFHYLDSFDDICRNVHKTLAGGGTFIFSVEHPIFTAQGAQEWVYAPNGENSGEISHWPVDNYFYQGKRESVFLGKSVVKYHKTLTTYIGGLIKAGFTITHFIEPEPSAEAIETLAEMKNELRRPMMLIISAQKN